MSEIIDTQIKSQKNKIRIFITWATVAALLLFSGLVYSLIKLDQQDSEILANQSTITNLSTALKDQTDQFIDCKESTPDEPIEGCDTPVADEPDKIVEDTTKSEVPTVKGEKGDKGDPPTTTDVLRAVNIHCGPLNNCVGNDGLDGQDGLDGITPSEQLLYGLVQQCFANGDCVAPKGDKGDTGEKGDKGDKGDQGLPGADSTVPGPPGNDGQTGPQGVGVSSITCGDSNNWTVAYTDGTSSTVDGPCRVVSLPPEGEGPPTGTE